uniref:ISXO2-like transposase domain-containing protein n=1 Tax=Candidatus Kentrum eta TaxID=2126337 RepID=A0A450UTP7_9GAMM|nr:MAG: hypothetical protein BECKH772C_GA0070978_1000421 [Candidatus Kentron sp. H]
MISSTIVPGTLVYTDEYSIYDRLPESGYGHKTVFVIATANMPVMRMSMICAKYMSISWKDSDLCYVLGYGPIVVFFKNWCLTILGFSRR